MPGKISYVYLGDGLAGIIIPTHVTKWHNNPYFPRTPTETYLSPKSTFPRLLL